MTDERTVVVEPKGVQLSTEGAAPATEVEVDVVKPLPLSAPKPSRKPLQKSHTQVLTQRVRQSMSDKSLRGDPDAETMTPQEMFRAVDVDDSGTVDEEEFVRLHRELPMPPLIRLTRASLLLLPPPLLLPARCGCWCCAPRTHARRCRRSSAHAAAAALPLTRADSLRTCALPEPWLPPWTRACPCACRHHHRPCRRAGEEEGGG